VQRHNWLSSLSQGISVCLSRDPKVLFNVQDYTYQGDLSQSDDVWESYAKFSEALPQSKEESEITRLIGNLIKNVTEL
jgi:hypothetical protein